MATLRVFPVQEFVQVDGVPSVEWKNDDGDVFRIILKAGRYPVTHTDSRGAKYFGSIRTVLQTYEKGDLDVDHVIANYKLEANGTLLVLWRDVDDDDINQKPVDSAKTQVVKDVALAGAPEFRRELVYTGRAGRSMSMMYREYSNETARTAFSQQLQYDVERNAVIGYEGARFLIVSSSNTEIVYEVLSPIPPR